MIQVFAFRLLFYTHLTLLLSASYGNGSHDKRPPSFSCGSLGRIHYPFTKAEEPECGLIAIHGCDNSSSAIKTIQLQKNGRILVLNGVVQPQNYITVLDPSLHNELMNYTCLALNNNISSLPHDSPLVSFHIHYKVTMYRCNHSLNVRPPSDFMKHTCPGYDLYYDSSSSYLPPNDEQVHSSFSKCSVLQLPRKDLTDTKDLLSFLTAQMVIEVRLSDECDKCYNHMGGQCRLDRNNTFLCDKGTF
ncbi:LEAF RUST 10 DISEASE-RESISTANCE LOCUS RECEPTOR-LIKE PROTEIN KINASE-like 1.1 [Senna tora]|uniref:LEAF RUST 10 DISEASE-RESISTANCE LOCUS RECEPTOR-LIKE PROTEIN KINASE-like 1.1 n=1 Tax=Senna tora TaxID=362788 RepID=A0A834WQ90_9FABA|nr:LEAF RUST 10 DISEASE-RESISTANCE LOCUS RECEPTOR-LIKE PROTEIN KINASE-like 1.1 [Senna tora]